MTFLNEKRLRDYPRLMLFTTWLILAINLILHQGWIGAFGQMIGGDFIMFYSTGLIFRANPNLLFDFDAQTSIQQALVKPTILTGYNPFMNPPYMAPFYSLWTFLSLHWSIMLWSFLAIISVFISAKWLHKLLQAERPADKLSYGQLVIIFLSFFPFIEGLLSGQNHWMTLLLISGIVFSMFKEKWYLAGILAGLLIYKPQFILGFIIIWLIWKNFKSLLSFGLVAASWVGVFILFNGLDLFRIYLQQTKIFMALPYIAGFPKYLLVTFYGFVTSIFPQDIQSMLTLLSNLLFIISSIGLVWLAFYLRKGSIVERIPAIVAALILPLLATPYALLHDLIILIPAFVLWKIYDNSQTFIRISFIIYMGAFFLTFIGAITRIAWVSLLVIGLSIALILWVSQDRKPHQELTKE